MMTKSFDPVACVFNLNKENISWILKRELLGQLHSCFIMTAHVTKAAWFIDGDWVEGSYSSGRESAQTWRPLGTKAQYCIPDNVTTEQRYQDASLYYICRTSFLC